MEDILLNKSSFTIDYSYDIDTPIAPMAIFLNKLTINCRLRMVPPSHFVKIVFAVT